MPIRFVHSDDHYECDTPEEAVGLRRLLRQSEEGREESATPLAVPTKQKDHSVGANGTVPPKSGSSGAPPKQAKGRNSVASFVAELNQNGRTILRALGKSPRPARTNDIAQLAGLDANIIGPIFKHIYAVAERHGLGKGDVVQTSRDPNDPAYKLRYVLTDPVRKAVEEIAKEPEEMAANE